MQIKHLGEIFIPSSLETAEELTKRYLDLLEYKGVMPAKNTYKPTRVRLPQSLEHIRDQNERTEFFLEQYSRWINGHEDFCGLMYGYYNFAPIKQRAGGSTWTEFRVYDWMEFELMESCLYGRDKFFGDNRGKGIVVLGSRAKGKSAKLGYTAYSVACTNEATSVLMTSKDLETIELLFEERVKYLHAKIPEYLRPETKTINRDEIGFQTKNGGGLNSSIILRAPQPQALEGYGGKLWCHDEAGKTKNLIDLFNRTESCLLADDGFTRIGVPILTGVAGEFDKYGSDYIEIWDKAEDHRLINWFIPAWVGMYVDKFGNEDIEKAVYEIFKQRKQEFNKGEEYGYIEMQKRPLTPEEALQTSSGSVLPKDRIMLQATYLANNPDPIQRGNMDWVFPAQQSRFVPAHDGKVEILEHPRSINKVNSEYLGFIDAYDRQSKMAVQGSMGACYIWKRPKELSKFQMDEIATKLLLASNISEKVELLCAVGGLPVAEYIDGPDDPRDFAENAAKLFIYYGAITLCEKFPSLIFDHLIRNYESWMQFKPLPPETKYLQKKHVSVENKGIKFDETWKMYRTSELQNYWRDYYDRVFFKRLVRDSLSYDPEIQRKKYDSVDAFGGILLHDKQSLILNYLFNPMKDQKGAALFGFRPFGSGIKPIIR